MSLADCTVLVVEDHEFQRRTMLQILANLGAGALQEAADGEGALELLGGGAPADVVVCDLDMPGMDGVEFLRHLAERAIPASVVIVSALDDAVVRAAETTARAYGVEVLGVVRKPLTARRLLEVVGLHQPVRPARTAASAPPSAWQEALAAGAVTALAAPRVDLRSGRIAGVRVGAVREADGERHAAERDAVAPEPAAAVADLLLAAACRALLDPRVGPGLDATVVLPPAALADLGLADRLAARAAAHGVAPQRVTIALPGRPALPATPGQLDVLTRLRLRGFGLGLEEPATPTAGEDLPLTEVGLACDSGDEALEAGIAAFQARGVRVVALGCGTAARTDAVAQLGCDRAQGLAVGPVSVVEEALPWAEVAT
ncbi:response regulator [Conexibacter sp. SYSU D00693]|uniref:response regulator n=1 Tax=Conexibacter sp. SYSU D00693 TaxID=2812560 RepID=UPI00196AB096|nr:response regulator [Conexibacter sp. SYSU D00693]